MEINVRGWKWAHEAPGGMLEPGMQEWPVLITGDTADSKQLGKHRGGVWFASGPGAPCFDKGTAHLARCWKTPSLIRGEWRRGCRGCAIASEHPPVVLGEG